MKSSPVTGVVRWWTLVRYGRFAEAAAQFTQLVLRPKTTVEAPAETGEAASDVQPQRPLFALPPLPQPRRGSLAPPARRTAPRAPSRSRRLWPRRAAPATGRRHAVAGTFAARSSIGAAGSRDYKLYVPSGYHGAPCPLIVMLHGCGQSVDDFAAGTKMNAVADEFGCLVAYPAQSASANRAKCWNWFNPRDQQRGIGEPAIVVDIVREIARDCAVDPLRIYAAGLSAGGSAAAVLGEQYPDVFAAIGIHSGVACGVAHDVSSAFDVMNGRTLNARAAWLESQSQGRRQPVPTVIFHGDRDRTIHPSNGDLIVASVPGAGLQSTAETDRVSGGHAYTRQQLRDASGRLVVERWTIHGAGHAWSGGDRSHSYTDPAGPDASEAMLRFFLAHRRSALVRVVSSSRAERNGVDEVES